MTDLSRFIVTALRIRVMEARRKILDRRRTDFIQAGFLLFDGDDQARRGITRRPLFEVCVSRAHFFFWHAFLPDDVRNQ